MAENNAGKMDELLKKWRTFSPNQRLMLAGGSAIGLVFLVAMMFGTKGETPEGMKRKDTPTHFNLPVSKDLSMEQLSARVEEFSATEKENKKALESFIQQQEAEKANAKTDTKDLATADMARELKNLKVEIDTLKARKPAKADASDSGPEGTPPGLNDQLPNPGGAPSDNSGPPPAGQGDSGSAIVEAERPKLRVIGGGKKKIELTEDEEKTPVGYMPMGSNFEGILLNGMDAPTSSATRKNPVPALIRLDTDAILPSLHRYDIRECFVIVTGFGVMSTERAQLQTTAISCIKSNGDIIESKMAGYVVGEDGKVGVRGRLVTKQGALLAKTFAAGLLSGLAEGMTPTYVNTLNTNPGSNAQYQMPNINNVLQTGAAQGISDAAGALSKFYLDMAHEMFPVVEIDAMRRVTVVLLKGIKLAPSNDADVVIKEPNKMSERK